MTRLLVLPNGKVIKRGSSSSIFLCSLVNASDCRKPTSRSSLLSDPAPQPNFFKAQLPAELSIGKLFIQYPPSLRLLVHTHERMMSFHQLDNHRRGIIYHTVSYPRSVNNYTANSGLSIDNSVCLSAKTQNSPIRKNSGILYRLVNVDSASNSDAGQKPHDRIKPTELTYHLAMTNMLVELEP